MDLGYVNSGPVAAKRFISLCLAPVYNSGTGQNVAGVQCTGRSLSCRGWLMSVKHRVHIVKRYAFGLLYYELLNIPVMTIFLIMSMYYISNDFYSSIFFFCEKGRSSETLSSRPKYCYSHSKCVQQSTVSSNIPSIFLQMSDRTNKVVDLSSTWKLH